MQFYAKPLLLRKQKTKRHRVIKYSFSLLLLHLLFLFITSCATTNQRNNSSSPIEIKTGDTGTGTGFLFSSSDYVITSYHVVHGAKSIKIQLINGETIEATIAAKDTENDIAILKMSKTPISRQNIITIGDSSSVKTGDRVFTYGFPLIDLLGNQEPRYSEGFVNSLSGISNNPNLFQVSIPIQPGNSGGPVFNEKEELIGIATSSIDSEQTRKVFGAIPQNVNFAIKSSHITNLLSKLPDTFIRQKGIVPVPIQQSSFKERVKNDIVIVEAVPKFKPAVVKFDYKKEERFRKELERQLEQEKEEIRREKEIVERERKLLERERQIEKAERLRRERNITEREGRLQAWERELQTDRRKAQRDNRNQFRKKLRHCDVACGPGTDTYEMIRQQQRQYGRMNQRRNRNRYSRYGTHYPWRRQDIEPLGNQNGNKPRGNFNFNIRIGN